MESYVNLADWSPVFTCFGVLVENSYQCYTIRPFLDDELLEGKVEPIIYAELGGYNSGAQGNLYAFLTLNGCYVIIENLKIAFKLPDYENITMLLKEFASTNDPSIAQFRSVEFDSVVQIISTFYNII